MLRKLIIGLALASAVALPLANTAEAAIGDGIAASQIASQWLPVEKAQFVFGGRQYCWYDDGWQGPGWYWCGYAYRTGFGWGGGFGWHGWRGGHRGGGGRHGGGGHGGGGHHGGGGPGGGGGLRRGRRGRGVSPARRGGV